MISLLASSNGRVAFVTVRDGDQDLVTWIVPHFRAACAVEDWAHVLLPALRFMSPSFDV